MNLSQITKELASNLRLRKFDIVRVGHGYHRVFIIDLEGVTLGRMCFKDEKYEHTKWYKAKLHGPEIEVCSSDEAQYCFEHWKTVGKFLSHEDYLRDLKRAERIHNENVKEKQRHRETLPLRKRKRITGIGVRATLLQGLIR